jgi:hypothetical protein
MGYDPLTGRDDLPGIDTPIEQDAREFLLDADHKAVKGIVIDDTSVDAGNAGKTHILRPGLALIRGAGTGGKFVPADHASAPADTAILEAVILMHYVNMRGADGVARDKTAQGLWHGRVQDSQIIYVDLAYDEDIRAALPQVRFE